MPVTCEGLTLTGTESGQPQPEAIGSDINVGEGHMRLSFAVLGFSPGEGPYGNFVHTVDTLAKREDPEFVAIGGSPERPIVAVNKAVELMAPGRVTPVVTWETARTSTRLRDTLLAYAAEGISELLVAPTRAQLEGTANFLIGREPADLLELAHKTGEFSRLGVVVRPEAMPYAFGRDDSIDKQYGRIATELNLAQFAVTQFVLATDPYTGLLEAMREHDVHTPITPGLLLFTEPWEAVQRAQEASLTIPDQLAGIYNNDKQHGTDPEASRHRRQTSMRYSIELGRDLLQLGAPSLHIYTNNNMRWLPDLTNGLREDL